MSFEENLSSLIGRYDELQALMMTATGPKFVQLSKEFSDLGPVVEEIQALRRLQKEFDDAKALGNSGDPDMRAMAEEEFHRLKPEVTAQEEKVRAAESALRQAESQVSTDLVELQRLQLEIKKIDEEFYEELEEILIGADVGVNTVMALIDELRDEVKKRKIEEPAQLQPILSEKPRERKRS